jgi:hypothetical protein
MGETCIQRYYSIVIIENPMGFASLFFGVLQILSSHRGIKHV